MSEHTEALPHAEFSDLVEWKAAQRRKDVADIAAGVRTSEEVQHQNTWLILDSAGTTILNEYDACEAL